MPNSRSNIKNGEEKFCIQTNEKVIITKVVLPNNFGQYHICNKSISGECKRDCKFNKG